MGDKGTQHFTLRLDGGTWDTTGHNTYVRIGGDTLGYSTLGHVGTQNLGQFFCAETQKKKQKIKAPKR